MKTAASTFLLDCREGPNSLAVPRRSHQHKHPHHCCQENGGRQHPPNTTHLPIPTANLSDNTTATVPYTGLSVPFHLLLLLLSLSIPISTKCIEFGYGFVLKGLAVVLGFDLMGNCWCGCNPSIYRVSSNVKSESPKNQSPSLREGVSPTKLPSNPEEVEDLRRDTGVNPLIAFTFNELKVVTGNFRQDNLLGGGGFGSVYKGFIGEDLKKEGLEPLQVAVKVHDGDKSFQGHREWLAEVIFLGQLSHPNLVKLIGYCCEDDHRVLIYEYMARGSVENNLFSRILIPLPWSIRMKIALGAAKGLAFLHEAEKPVIYRDFKTSNILLDMDYNAKLSDFGLAKDGPMGDKSHVSTRIMGTLGYAAPEYMMTGHLTARSDVYSFGVVLLELLTGRKSLDKSRPAREQILADWALPLLGEKKKLLDIIDPSLEGDYPIKGVHKAAMLAYHCLNRNPKARPLMRDIVDSLEPLQIAPDPPTAAPITVRTETPVQEAQREAASCS